MSNLFTDWAVDQAIDRAMEKAEDLKIQGNDLTDKEIDKLITKEHEKIMEQYDGAS